jgi:integrase
MTKRANGEGTCRQLPNGRWEARYYGSDGRQHSVSKPTQKEALAALKPALEAAAAQLPAPDRTLTVSGWLDEWLATNVRPRLRPRTVASYEETCKRYIRPALGRVQLSKLGAPDIARMLDSLTARGDLSPTTVRYAYAVLRIALGRAVKSGRAARNAALYVDAPAKASRELRPLSVEEVGTFRKAIARHRFEALFLTALGTGLRQGELLALRWSDVDLAAGTLTVRHTLTRGSSVLAEPKTEKSRRVLRLPLPVTVALKRLQRRQETERKAARVWNAAGYVFTTASGGPLDSRHVTQSFQAVLLKAGIRRQRFHDLRHAFATLQLEAGAELFDVSRALGHADIGTTANVYGHFTEAMADRMADRMAGILGSTGKVAQTR